MNKIEIYEFLKSVNLCVLSTIKGDKSQSSLMGFGVNEDLEFIFGTSNKSRKYQNVTQNKNVSVVVGWLDSRTVQIEGEVKFLEGTELEKYKKIYFDLRPSVKKYEFLPDQTYFKVRPVWIRYTDVAKKPWDIFEINFDTISKIK